MANPVLPMPHGIAAMMDRAIARLGTRGRAKESLHGPTEVKLRGKTTVVRQSMQRSHLAGMARLMPVQETTDGAGMVGSGGPAEMLGMAGQVGMKGIAAGRTEI